MKTLQLTQGYITMVDDDVYEWASKFKWYYIIGYANRKFNNKTIYLHRVIINASKGMQVDHINGDGLDNRKENLRLCSKKENLRNQKLSKANTSGYKGVTWNKYHNKWCAEIKLNQKRIFLGYYETKEQAALAYNEAAIKYHGIFARLNKLN